MNSTLLIPIECNMNILLVDDDKSFANGLKIFLEKFGINTVIKHRIANAEAQLKKIKFDVILLGMGNDGHIASIFQNDLNLKSNKITRPVLREDFKRVTLNIKIINNAKNIYLWLNSKKKFDIYKKLILRKKNRTPVSFLNKKKLFVFCIS